jgi:hypothetical protein
MTCATCSRHSRVGPAQPAIDLKTLSGRTPTGGTPSTMTSPRPFNGSSTEITLGAPSIADPVTASRYRETAMT